MTAIDIKLVENKNDLRAFIDAQHEANKHDPAWIRPLIFERFEHLDPKKNVFLSKMDYRFWVAYRDGKPVGRISAQISERYLEIHNDATAQFGSFDAIDDETVASALIDTAFDWLKSQGIKRVTGPFSHSINEESGVLVDGYDVPPNLMMGHNPPYYDRLLKAAGLAKADDLFCYLFDIATPPTPKLRRILDRFENKPNIRIRTMDKRRYMQEIDLICDIFNDAWRDNWGFVPFGKDEARYLANSLKPIIDENFVLICEMDDRPVAMIMAAPDLNNAARDLNGRLMPFGWAKLVWRLKVQNPSSSRVPLMGVRHELRTSPLSGQIALGMIEELRRRGQKGQVKTAELSWILESNRHMANIIDALGAKRYKTYRVYEKALH